MMQSINEHSTEVKVEMDKLNRTVKKQISKIEKTKQKTKQFTTKEPEHSTIKSVRLHPIIPLKTKNTTMVPIFNTITENIRNNGIMNYISA